MSIFTACTPPIPALSLNRRSFYRGTELRWRGVGSGIDLVARRFVRRRHRPCLRILQKRCAWRRQDIRLGRQLLKRHSVLWFSHLLMFFPAGGVFWYSSLRMQDWILIRPSDKAVFPIFRLNMRVLSAAHNQRKFCWALFVNSSCYTALVQDLYWVKRLAL